MDQHILPTVLVWGQLIGSPAAGFTVVAHSPDIDLHRAESFRHQSMARFRLPANPFAGLAFCFDPGSGTNSFVCYEQSARPQTRRGTFIQEYYVIWDRVPFEGNGFRFWSVSLPRDQIYDCVQVLDESDLPMVSSQADQDFLCSILQSRKDVILGLLDLLLGQKDTIMLPASGSIDEDASLMRATHLLVPPKLRYKLSFVSNMAIVKGDQARISFSSDLGQRSTILSFRPESLEGSRIPSYPSLLHLYFTLFPGRNDLGRLLRLLTDLPVSLEKPLCDVGAELSITLWDRIGADVVAETLKGDRTDDFGLSLLAAGTEHYGAQQRRDILEKLAQRISKLAREGVDVSRPLTSLADAIERNAWIAVACPPVLSRCWREQPQLVLGLSGELLRVSESVNPGRWSNTILPLLSSVSFDRDEQVIRATNWLSSGQITFDQFLELCDRRRPQNLYELVARLTHEQRDMSTNGLAQLSSRHPSLHQLSVMLTLLQKGDSTGAADELARTSRVSRSAYEWLLVLLVQLVSERPPSVSARLLSILGAAVQIARQQPLSSEPTGRILAYFKVISAQSVTSATTRGLLSLGRSLGIGEEAVASCLTRGALWRYRLSSLVQALRSLLRIPVPS